ncbi:uncharacterized protein LOC123684885 [Harmonia axyridis]|uniref:uncharacterized protein LOC123684885 n=1 Tax=Harmonia axyridis TaxID=115357 RepID=UPI001E278A0B|nr:uncharacterized protein LOC123684885 [Harmonia axyridis]
MLKIQIGLLLYSLVMCYINGSRDFKVLHFGKCGNYHDTPSLVSEKEIEVSDGIHRNTVIEMNLEKDLNDIEARLSIFKCDDGTCNHFWKDHEIKDICVDNKLNSFEDIMVRFIIDSTEPKITSCPVRKGTYRTTFASGNAFFHNFSLAAGVWSVKWSLLSEEEMISCYECQVKVSGEL